MSSPSASVEQSRQQQDVTGTVEDSQASSEAVTDPTALPDTLPDKPGTIIAINTSSIAADNQDTLLKILASEQADGAFIEYVTIANLDDVFLFVTHPDTDAEAHEALTAELAGAGDGVVISPNRAYERSAAVNDTEYGSQWNLDSIRYEQAFGVLDIGAPRQSPIIAVLDEGIDVTENELTNQIWVNSDETAGNGIDDDSNGYIDDRNGCNFYEARVGDASTACTNAAIYDMGENHGQRIAKIIAAETNNNLGMAGICPNCRIMVLDVDDTGVAFTSDIVTALSYAVANGADVINFSYVASCPFDASSDVLASPLNSLINTHGVAWVQAAGNFGNRTESNCTTNCAGNSYCSSTARQQAFYYVDGKNVANTVVVGAIDQSDARASFSNYDGSNDVITIAAPGESFPVFESGSLVNISGTSFAAPHAAGAIGLGLSYTVEGTDVSMADLTSRLYSTGTNISTDQDISGRKLNLEAYATTIKSISELKDQYEIFVSRFWSPSNRSHFFTGSQSEANYVRNTYTDDQWRFEGNAYTAFSRQVSGTTPVYRFWSPQNKAHFYTVSRAERDSIRATYTDQQWRYEGISFYVYPTSYSSSSRTVYRFWSPQNRAHFFTSSSSERDAIRATYTDQQWRYEGASWKVPQ